LAGVNRPCHFAAAWQSIKEYVVAEIQSLGKAGGQIGDGIQSWVKCLNELSDEVIGDGQGNRFFWKQIFLAAIGIVLMLLRGASHKFSHKKLMIAVKDLQLSKSSILPKLTV